MKLSISRYFDLILAPMLWFACLSVLYGIATLICARLIGQAGHYASLAIIVSTLLVLLWMAVRPGGNVDPFTRSLSRTLAGLSILATVWLGLPLATQVGCAAP